jgi:hypothetical protein
LGGEHRQGAPGQIKAGSTPACLQVQGTAGLDKAAGIGDDFTVMDEADAEDMMNVVRRSRAAKKGRATA